jgi:hypothetical protein
MQTFQLRLRASASSSYVCVVVSRCRDGVAQTPKVQRLLARCGVGAHSHLAVRSQKPPEGAEPDLPEFIVRRRARHPNDRSMRVTAKGVLQRNAALAHSCVAVPSCACVLFWEG